MIYFHSASDFYLAGPSAVTLGKFDGVHLGHQLLMKKIKSLEKEKGCISSAFAIEMRNGSWLMTEEEQQRKIRECGIQALIRCPFVPEISGMSPEEFVREILVKKLHARFVVIGTDFHFGYKRSGDAAFLRQCGKEYDFETFVIRKAVYQGREISSSYIREELSAGKMEDVSNMLGAPYSIESIVLHGKHLGSGLGIPTINLIPPSQKLLPPNGVYISETMIGDRCLPGITNIGTKPTVDGSFKGVETYLYDIHEDLYGKNVRIRLLEYIRPEKKFGSLDELKGQMFSDIERGRDYFRVKGIVGSQPVSGSDRPGFAGGRNYIEDL